MGYNAILLPGQGCHDIGMGRDLFKKDEYFLNLINIASEQTGEDLKRLCLKGPEEKLYKSFYLQPLVASISLALFRRLVDKGVKPDYILGHSLGEITALGAAGVVSHEEAVVIAAKRGELMDRAASGCNGGMMAVMFMDLDKIIEVLEEINRPDKINLANDNAPKQVVLSGDNEFLDIFKGIAKEHGARFKRLNISGPWHSSIIEPARKEYASWIEKYEFRKPAIKFIMNATGRPEDDPAVIKKLTTLQLVKPVYFRSCMEYLRSLDIESLFEVGPGSVLTGLSRANGFKRSAYNMQNIDSLHSIKNISNFH